MKKNLILIVIPLLLFLVGCSNTNSKLIGINEISPVISYDNQAPDNNEGDLTDYCINNSYGATKEEPYSDDCQQSINEDITSCNLKGFGDEIKKCLINVAVRYNNVNICQELIETKQNSACVISIAINAKNVSLCEMIEDDDLFNECIKTYYSYEKQ